MINISSNIDMKPNNQTQETKNTQQSAIKNLYTQKLSKEEVNDIRKELQQNIAKFASDVVNIQASFTGQSTFEINYNDFQNFLQDIGYDGKPIAELSKEEASKLVGEDGLFGIEQTAQRIANFVISGANGDEDRFRAGREGMLTGFKMAEKMWGDTLPDISQKTMQSAIEMVDKAMSEHGFSIFDTQV